MPGTITTQTCAANCWYARETDCRCACGGANHGILLVDGAEQPRRTSRILGTVYVLAAAGSYSQIGGLERAFIHSDGVRERFARTTGSGYYYMPSNERGSVAWTKLASESQSKNWPEARDAVVVTSYGRSIRPTLLWIRQDAIEAFDTVQAAVVVVVAE